MKKILIAIATFFSTVSIGLACTDFRVMAEDGSVIVTRSMEFSIDMKSNLISSPREKEFKMIASNGKPGLTWKAKYGYIFLDSMGLGVPVDGMNEEGLSYEALLFPDEAGYQTVTDTNAAQAISYLHFGDWILGNFKTVDEVREAVKNIVVIDEKLPQLDNQSFPVHFSIFDKSGKGVVIEYVKGKLNVYDHMGVMTNSPTYDWQVINLRNYVQLSPSNPKPIIAQGVTYAATGQGAGMLGLPGDISPPSRFVKMAVMLNTIQKPKDAAEALNVSQHMINNVDIPLGFVRENQNNNQATLELTQWVVFKDLTGKKMYYRTYDDLTLKEIDLAKVDLSPNAASLKMPIASSAFTVDMTEKFLGSK